LTKRRYKNWAWEEDETPSSDASQEFDDMTDKQPAKLTSARGHPVVNVPRPHVQRKQRGKRDSKEKTWSVNVPVSSAASAKTLHYPPSGPHGQSDDDAEGDLKAKCYFFVLLHLLYF